MILSFSSRTWQEHHQHLKEVFKRLEMADLKIKCSKCKVLKTKVYCLCYLIDSNSVQPLLEKVEVIKKLIVPTNIDKLRQFLGLVGFYRKFIPFFADITNCLTMMFRKGVAFVWITQCDRAFEILKEELCKMPTLQYPNPSKLYKLFTDASKYSYSGIFHEGNEDEPDTLIPIAYFSGSFSKTATVEHVTQKNVMQSTSLLNSFHFIWQGPSVHSIVILNSLHPSSPQVCQIMF